MDAIKWQNLVRLDTHTEVLTAGLSFRVGKQSNVLGRIWTQLFGEGFDKTRLARNILNELTSGDADAFLKSVSNEDLGKAMVKLTLLKGKFSRNEVASTALDRACLKIGQIIYNRSQEEDAKPRALSHLTDSSETIGSESPRELSPRSHSINKDTIEANKALIEEDIRTYHPEIRTELQNQMRYGWANGHVFEPKEVRKLANEMALVRLIGLYSTENIEAALETYCGNRPDRMNYGDFIALINKGAVKLDAAVFETIRNRCEVVNINFSRMARTYYESVAAQLTLGPKVAKKTLGLALARSIDKPIASADKVYLSFYNKFIRGRYEVEMDPEAKLQLSSGRNRLETIRLTPQLFERIKEFVEKMPKAIADHKKNVEMIGKKEKAATTIENSDFAVKREKLENQIELLSRELEGFDKAHHPKSRLQEALIEKSELYAATSDPARQKILQEEIEALNAALIKEHSVSSAEKMASFNKAKGEKIEGLKAKMDELALLHARHEKALADIQRRAIVSLKRLAQDFMTF